VHERLSDRVRNRTTLNEPFCSAFTGHAEGGHAPGLEDDDAAMRSAHHLLLGHGLAVGAMCSHDPDGRYGLTLNLYPVDPASDDPADADAARRSPWVGSRDVEFVKRGLPRTEMGWEIDAQGLYDVLTRLHRECGSRST
jgi:beta-glucosidase